MKPKALKRSGNTLKAKSGEQYKIFTRTNITPSKPKHFLLQIQGKKKKYISSLYGTYPEYQLEYQGTRYTLTLSDNSAELKDGGEYVPSV